MKRLFFAMKVHAPWARELPDGRVMKEGYRHMTLVFLGNIDFDAFAPKLALAPQPCFKVGQTGFFNECLFLPPSQPRVVAWRAEIHQKEKVLAYQEKLKNWLLAQHLSLEKRERPFLPHVTVARSPCAFKEWQKNFVKTPFYLGDITLFESLGAMVYVPLWQHSLLPPFEEIPHTADIAFRIRGENPKEIAQNAFTALAFKFPGLLSYFKPEESLESLEEVISSLNAAVTCMDTETGCPFKAISLHGELQEKENVLSWEMIVDV